LVLSCPAELLLKQKDVDIQAASNSKATPLHEAAAARNTGLVQLLLQKGASAVDSSPGYPPLHAACQGCSCGQTCMPVVELLLQAAPEQLQQQVSSPTMTAVGYLMSELKGVLHVLRHISMEQRQGLC
jgi:ankyrin repeat protein